MRSFTSGFAVPRFVLLYHETPAGSGRPSHWDLMLEQGQGLRTWALEQSLQPNIDIACQALADHRLAYLDYEGPVSGDRGQVTRVDWGNYTLLSEGGSAFEVRLSGQHLVGRLQIKPAAHNWVARFSLEAPAA